MKSIIKEYGAAFFLFIILEATVVLLFFYEYRREELRHSIIHLSNLKSLYDGAFVSYDNATKIIFNNIINKPLILQKFAKAHSNQQLRDVYRKEIYSILKADYNLQKEIGLRQLHFHFKEGTSYLRMHAPEKYGDYLFDKRYSLQLANAEKKHVSGFEEGHFADGFRYVYPLIHQDEHIGTVEMSITADGIMDHISKIDPGNYHFIMKKEKVISTTYTDWREAHYKLSILSEEFVVDKSFREHKEVTNLNKILKTKVAQKILEFKPFVQSTMFENQEYIIIFQPVKNIKGDDVAYLIQYKKEDFFGKNLFEFFRNVLIATLLGILIFYSYMKIRSQHRELGILNRNLEERVEQRTLELETAVKELEDFNYSVSHDLRAPLRAMDGFSQILLKDYSKILDNEGKRLLNVVSKNSIQMGRLIDDILFFSRLGRIKMHPREINMDSLAQEVWKNLKSTIGKRKVQFDLKPLVQAYGDIDMVRQVLVNLLSNALKFTMGKKTALIEIGSTEENNENIYYIKDNGCGFDMKYTNKLFGLFSRLHGMEDYEGTGIGLAVVKRIIIKHGGRVWAKGVLNEGASFYFTLPKA